MVKRVLIVGGGVIGLCTAYYSRLAGLDVTVIDRGPADHGGCSFGNAGMIVPSHFTPLAAPGMVRLGLKWMWNPRSPFYVKPRLSLDLLKWGWQFSQAASDRHVAASRPLLRDMNFASQALYESLAEQLGDDFFLTRRGLLMLCKTGHALQEESVTAETANKLGVPAQVLDAAAAAKIEPAVQMDIAGAVYFPKDCHLSPAKFMTTIGAKLKTMGVAFLNDTTVTGWRNDGARVSAVVTNNGDISADEFVLAGGAWSAETIAGLRLKMPMQAGKGYSLTLPRPRQLPTVCAIFTEARVAVTPMDGALRFGGTMEIAGLNERISPKRVAGIVESVPKYFPAFSARDFELVEPWVGLRPCSPDGLPYVGRFGQFKNLCAATGHAMMGMSLGPITGKLVSQLLAGGPPEIDISMLAPDRYMRLRVTDAPLP